MRPQPMALIVNFFAVFSTITIRNIYFIKKKRKKNNYNMKWPNVGLRGEREQLTLNSFFLVFELKNRLYEFSSWIVHLYARKNEG